MKKASTIIFFIILLSVSNVEANALAPPITGYNLSTTRPLTSNHLIILITFALTDSTGDLIYDTMGLQGQVYWSRDKINYNSVAMTLVATQQMEGLLPTQDGSDNVEYDYGIGDLYWYVILSNHRSEVSYLYTALNPNSEVTYVSNVIPTGTNTDTTPNQPVVVDVPLFAVLGDIADQIFKSQELTLGFALLFIVFLSVYLGGGKKKKKKKGLIRG